MVGQGGWVGEEVTKALRTPVFPSKPLTTGPHGHNEHGEWLPVCAQCFLGVGKHQGQGLQAGVPNLPSDIWSSHLFRPGRYNRVAKQRPLL
jgi:hypothetical protein